MNVSAFTPGATVTLTAATVSSASQLSSTGAAVEVQNAGSVAVFVKFGDSTVTAAVTDYPVLAGQSKLIGRASSQTYIATITASGGCTVYATTGEGA